MYRCLRDLYIKQGISIFLIALFIMTVGTKLASARTLNMLGGTLVCVGYIISSRAEDIRLLLLSYGVIQGNIFKNTQPKIYRLLI